MDAPREHHPFWGFHGFSEVECSANIIVLNCLVTRFGSNSEAQKLPCVTKSVSIRTLAFKSPVNPRWIFRAITIWSGVTAGRRVQLPSTEKHGVEARTNRVSVHKTKSYRYCSHILEREDLIHLCTTAGKRFPFTLRKPVSCQCHGMI